MTTILHPSVSATIGGEAATEVAGGRITLDSLAIPYATGQVEVPLTEDLDVDVIDPRADTRVVVSASAGGSWTPGAPTYSPWVESRRNLAVNTCRGVVNVYISGSRGTLSAGADFIRLTITDALAVSDAQRIESSTQARVLQTVSPGQIITLSANGRTTAAAASMRVQVSFWTASNVLVGATFVGVARAVNSSTFTALSPLTVTAPATAARMLWGVTLAGSGPRAIGNTVDAQNVLLEVAPDSRPFFDGTTPDGDLARYQWLGTANQSASTEETRTRLADLPPTWTPDTPRTFNLGLRERTIDHVAKTVHLELASDEALLHDYAALVEETGARPHEDSLRAICNYVLGKIGASLGGSGPDAPAHPYWGVTNLHPNPSVVGTTAGFRPSPSASALTLIAFGDDSASSVRWTANAGVSNLIAGDAETSYRAIPGHTYVFSATIVSSTGRTAQAAIQWLSNGGASPYAPTLGPTITTNGSTWTRVTVIAKAPPGAEYLQPYVSTLGNTAGQFHYLDTVLVYEGTELVPFFNGDTADTPQYVYEWTGTAHQSASNRRAVVERPLEQFTWKPGVSAWEFLEPFTSSEGFRLFCDEKRVWRLIDPATYTVPGSITIAGFNATNGADTISREDADVFSTGVVVRYAWDDEAGESQVAYDVAGTPSRVFVLDYTRPYPGPGAAQAILDRRNGTGRSQNVTALVDWTTTPGMEASITLPEAPQQRGKLSSVIYSLGDDALMDVATRGLIDIITGSVDALVGTVDALVGTVDAL